LLTEKLYVNRPSLKIYTLKGKRCKYCETAKIILKRNRIEFSEHKLSVNEASKIGIKLFPTFEICGIRIEGDTPLAAFLASLPSCQLVYKEYIRRLKHE